MNCYADRIEFVELWSDYLSLKFWLAVAVIKLEHEMPEARAHNMRVMAVKINGGGSIKPVSTTGVHDVAKSGPLGPTAPASTRGEKLFVRD